MSPNLHPSHLSFSPCMSPVSFMSSPLISTTPSITDTDLPNSNDQSIEHEDDMVPEDLIEALENECESPVFPRERVIEPDGASISTQELNADQPGDREDTSDDEDGDKKRKKKVFPLFMCIAPRLSRKSPKRMSLKKKKEKIKKEKINDSQIQEIPENTS